MSMQVNCPKCGADISDTYEPGDWSVGIVGGWFCDACDLGVGEGDVARDPLPDDVPIEPVDKDRPIGTPLSSLSSQPGDPNNQSDPRHAGYAEFCRIAKSWGCP
jgi:hypothetical protein